MNAGGLVWVVVGCEDIPKSIRASYEKDLQRSLFD